MSDSYTTTALKFQIFSGYAGLGLFLVSVILIWLNRSNAGFIALVLSTIITAAGLFSVLPFIAFAWGRDKQVVLFSIFMIALRSAAFQIGLIAGLIKYKVMKMKFDITKLSYADIQKVFETAVTRGTPFYISKLGLNVVLSVES